MKIKAPADLQKKKTKKFYCLQTSVMNYHDRYEHGNRYYPKKVRFDKVPTKKQLHDWLQELSTQYYHVSGNIVAWVEIETKRPLFESEEEKIK